MGDARMLGLALEDRFQQRCAFELVGVGLVSRRSCYVERDRVRDLRLVVVRIARRDLLFRRKIPLHARAMVDLVVVDVHRCDCIDVIPLALRFCTQRLAFFHGFETQWKALRRRRRVRIVQIAQRNAPVGDGALRVLVEDLLEGASRCAVPERVLI